MAASAPSLHAARPVQRRRSVVVCDAGSLPTTRRIALALGDDLLAYRTPVAVRGGALPLAGRALERRRLPAPLAERAVTDWTAREVARVALRRVAPGLLGYELVWRRNRALDRAAADALVPGTTAAAHYGAALATFERARALGGRTLLDYPIARYETAAALLEAEARRRPDLAGTLFGRGALFPRARELARVRRETELADVVLVGSKFAASTFADLDAERVAVVPYGVDAARFSPAAEPRAEGPLRVLFAGQLTQRKGVADVLDAVRLLPAGRVELTLAGPLVDRGRWLRAYDGRFRRLSALPPSAMPALYREADVLVLPSLVEGSALVVLEALASGVPAIVTPNAGADALRDGVEGFVVPIRSPSAVAERLDALARDPDLRARMGAAARRRALAFDWSRFDEAVRGVVSTLEGRP